MAIRQFRHRRWLGAIALGAIALSSFSPARSQEFAPVESPEPEASATPQAESAASEAEASEPVPSPAASSDETEGSASTGSTSTDASEASEAAETFVEVDLDALTLIPDPRTAERLESLFRLRVSGINARIQRRQADLQGKLADANSNDDDIRRLQRELSNLRAERDSLAIEHLLLMRQVTEKLVFPASFGSPAPATSASDRPDESSSF
ncbi:MAG: hypothetical protein AAFY15_01710 [Cyanobacteria bacterium J06648_11]